MKMKMNYSEVQAVIFAIASEMASRDSEERLTTTLSLDTTFADLNFDSIDGAEFASFLSDKIGFEVPEGELCTLRGKNSIAYERTSLRDVVNYIVENQGRLRKIPTLP